MNSRYFLFLDNLDYLVSNKSTKEYFLEPKKTKCLVMGHDENSCQVGTVV